MLDSDELARMMVEISAGWEWGDPRSEVLQTPEHKAKWGRLKVQMKEIADKGGIVDIPSGFPELTGHREKWPQPPRDTDDSKRRAVTRPSRPLVPEKPKKVSKPGPDRIERTYLAAQGVGGSSPSRPTHNRRSEACSVVVFSTSALWEQRWEQPAESFRIVLK